MESGCDFHFCAGNRQTVAGKYNWSENGSFASPMRSMPINILCSGVVAKELRKIGLAVFFSHGWNWKYSDIAENLTVPIFSFP